MYVIQAKIPRLLVIYSFALIQLIPLVTACLTGVYIRYEYLLMIPFLLAAAPLVALYNENRGANLKWLFYAAYPAHLAILALLATLI
jgi:hypothetical protein